MTNKLHIDFSKGLFDIEGDAAFVREVYADFRIPLLKGAWPGPEAESVPLDDAHLAAAAERIPLPGPLQGWPIKPTNPVSIHFSRHNLRRRSLKRYLHL